MSKQAYAAFLAAPSAGQLTDDASLLYVTTLTTLHEPAKILQNLTSRELKRKQQKIISAVEDSAHHTLAVEVETTIEFVSGGGAYLPGLDDNFVSDRIVNFPIVHFVHFDPHGKIHQIRQTWDQGSLLKHIEVIGTRGRNWPITDGIDQIRLIATCDKAVSSAPAEPQTPAAAKKQSTDEVVITSRAPAPRANNNNVTRDPHASLSLFESRDPNARNEYEPVTSHRSSMKPPSRDFKDLFAGADSDESAQTTPQQGGGHVSRTSIDNGRRPKVGGGQSYQKSRLFEVGDPSEDAPDNRAAATKTNPLKYKHFDLSEGGDAPVASPYKISPKKYNHFDFADGSDPADAPKPKDPAEAVKKSKHASQWDFADFSTPAKPGTKVRGQDVRHIGPSYSDDEQAAESPPKPQRIPQARRDADTHFSMTDEQTPEAAKDGAGKSRGTASNEGQGLYKNNVHTEDDGTQTADEPAKQRPLSSVTTNINAHRKVFDPQFVMADESPATKGAAAAHQGAGPGGIDGHKKAVSMMSANWAMYDQSPSDKKENKGIKTAGDGMGGRKGGRLWGIGDDSDGETPGGVNGPEFQKGIPSRGGRHVNSNEHWEF